MEKYSQVMILSEDSMHRSFVLGFLGAANVENHKIREVNAPFDEGGAKGPQGNSWVQSRFQTEVAYAQQRITGKRASTLLIVVYDADVRTVLEVQRDFDGKATASQRGCYAVLIPKRNIESWVYFDLNGVPYNETDDLGHCYSNKEARHAGVNLCKGMRTGQVDIQQLPPSMQACWPAFQKILAGV